MRHPDTLSARLLRFLLSGGAATAFHWSVMAALIVAGRHPLAATIVGALAGAALNYVLQSQFAFRSPRAHRDTLGPYIASVLLLWVVNALLFFLLQTKVELPVWIAQLLTTGGVTAVSYLLYQRVFHERDRQATDPTH